MLSNPTVGIYARPQRSCSLEILCRTGTIHIFIFEHTNLYVGRLEVLHGISPIFICILLQFVYMCVSIHISIHNIYICICIYTYLYDYIYLFLYTNVFVGRLEVLCGISTICVRMILPFVYTCISIYIYMYIHDIYTYMYMYIYIYACW